MKLTWTQIEKALAAYGQEGREQVEEFKRWKATLNYLNQTGDAQTLQERAWDRTRGEVA